MTVVPPSGEMAAGREGVPTPMGAYWKPAEADQRKLLCTKPVPASCPTTTLPSDETAWGIVA
jgi:hypothetical protein